MQEQTKEKKSYWKDRNVTKLTISRENHVLLLKSIDHLSKLLDTRFTQNQAITYILQAFLKETGGDEDG